MSQVSASRRPRVVLATSNSHKLREIASMLQDAPFELVGLDQFPAVVLPPETGSTFEENAVGKAVAAAQQTGLTAIADDSGLEVDALNGAPGIYSARYSDPGATDERNLRLVLEHMQEVPEEERSGRFVCALAVAGPGKETRVFRGTVEGRLAFEPRGENGFGYDPIFIIPEDGRTLAEHAPDEKNAISHRYRAVRASLPAILQYLP